jgi:hypothetical protein
MSPKLGDRQLFAWNVLGNAPNLAKNGGVSVFREPVKFEWHLFTCVRLTHY